MLLAASGFYNSSCVPALLLATTAFFPDAWLFSFFLPLGLSWVFDFEHSRRPPFGFIFLRLSSTPRVAAVLVLTPSANAGSGVRTLIHWVRNICESRGRGRRVGSCSWPLLPVSSNPLIPINRTLEVLRCFP